MTGDAQVRAEATPPQPWFARARAHAFVWSRSAQGVVVAVIVLNAVVLGLQAAPRLLPGWSPALEWLDAICLGVYVVEIALKLYADRGTFFRSGWNIFDFVVVALSLIPGTQTLAVLRALRVLRVLRLVSVLPSLRRVVDGLGRSIPGIASVAALLAIIFYVGAVMATTLFGTAFPHLFGTLDRSFFTLFQLMTLDDWANITREVSAEFALAPVFFIVFVVASALTVLNLVVAVIVDAMQQVDDRRDPVAEELAALRRQVERLAALHEPTPSAQDRSSESPR